MAYFKGIGGICTAGREDWNRDTRLSLACNDDGTVTLTIFMMANIHIAPHARITLPDADAQKLRDLLDTRQEDPN